MRDHAKAAAIVCNHMPWREKWRAAVLLGLLIMAGITTPWCIATAAEPSVKSSVFDDSPEHLAITQMLQAEGRDVILETASRVSVHQLEDFATVTISHTEVDGTTKSKIYLLRENDNWSAFYNLPLKKDHAGVFFILARSHCTSRFQHLKGMSYIDDSRQSKDPEKRTINFNCMELIDNKWHDHRLSLVFKYRADLGWAVVKSYPYKSVQPAPATAAKPSKKKKTTQVKAPASLQEAMKMSDLQTAISISYSQGEARPLQLIREGADLEHRDRLGYTPLHTAVTNKHSSLKIIRVLIAAGADVNAADKYGYTALHLVAGRGRNSDAPLVKLLIDAGADVNRQDKSGGTPLHHMTVRGSGCKALQVVEILRQAGADITIRNKYDQTVIDSAGEYNCHDLVKYLQDNSDEVRVQGKR